MSTSISIVQARFDNRMLGSVGSTPAHQYRTGTDWDTWTSSIEFGARPTREIDAPATTDDDQWQERALCAQTDPEAFFPEKGGSTREAKRICLGCEVRDACLEYALAHDERFGIWGGLSERERRRLKRGII